MVSVGLRKKCLENKMSVMGPDGKILQPGGGWWSPYGDTDEEIQKNMRVNKMANAPDTVRINPGYFTGSKNGDEVLRDFLGSIGALGGQAKEEYDKKQK
jgi:hypothetical protein